MTKLNEEEIKAKLDEIPDEDEEWRKDPDATPALHEFLKTVRSYENPKHTYIGWCPGDDYMSTKSDTGWNVNIKVPTWREFWHGKEVGEAASPVERMQAEGWKDNDWDLNLLADYYFSVAHNTEQCTACRGRGLNPGCVQLADTFYSDRDWNGEIVRVGWHDQITQDEVQALVDEGRLIDFTHTWKSGEGWQRREDNYIPTADEVNEANRTVGMRSHDAINRCILIEARAKRLGLLSPDGTTHCEVCNGNGALRTGPDRLVLYLWMLHPRKGTGRGITIESVDIERDIPEIKEFLRISFEQHKKHFEWGLA